MRLLKCHELKIVQRVLRTLREEAIQHPIPLCSDRSIQRVCQHLIEVLSPLPLATAGGFERPQ